MNRASYLVVDDDDSFRMRLSKALRDRGNVAFEAVTAEECRAIALNHQPERIILDLRLSNSSGLVLIELLKEIFKNAEILMLTGYGSIATAIDAVKKGAKHYLTKPADLDQIIGVFEKGDTQIPHVETAPTLSRVEWEHIERIMNDCEGNISKASKILGLHRRSLQRKLKMAPPRR